MQIKTQNIKYCRERYKYYYFLNCSTDIRFYTLNKKIHYNYIIKNRYRYLCSESKDIPVLIMESFLEKDVVYNNGKFIIHVTIRNNTISYIRFFKNDYYYNSKCPTEINFDHAGSIFSACYYNKYRVKHNTNGLPAYLRFGTNFEGKDKKKYYIEGKEYNKIDYFLKLIELQCK